MLRSITVLSLCLVTGLTGCASFSGLNGIKKTSVSATPNKSVRSSPTVGSSDFSTSNTLSNPTKLHLAYAAWHEQSGDFHEARDSYMKVLEKNPKDIDAILGLARIDRAYGRNDEADLHLKKALKLHPKDPKVFVAIGQAHASKQEWDQAIEKIQVACKLAPYDTIYEYHLAVVEAGAGDVPHAMEHFKRSVGEAEAHFNIGFILNEQGHSSDAEAHLVQSLKLKPDLKQAQAALTAIRSGKEEEILPAAFNKSGGRR